MWNGKSVTLFLYLYLIMIHAESFFKCTRLDCYPRSKRIYNTSCRLHKVNEYKTLADMTSHIKGDLNNIQLNVALYARNRANVYAPFVVNVSGSFCRFVKNRIGGIFELALMNVVSKSSNINHSCPYSGIVVVKDFYFDRKMLPIPKVPQKSFKVVIKFYEGLEYLGMLAYYTDVVESKTSR